MKDWLKCLVGALTLSLGAWFMAGGVAYFPNFNWCVALGGSLLAISYLIMWSNKETKKK